MNLVLFHSGIYLKNKKFGIIWVSTYVGSVLPFFYFKSGIIDPWFNLFIFLGIFFYICYTLPGKYYKTHVAIILSAVFIGLGILTKGPVALLIFLLTGFVFSVFSRFRYFPNLKGVILFLVFLILVGGMWFILQILSGNASVINDFIDYQIRLFQTRDAGHGGFLLYHFVVLFMGVFPASVFALPAFRFFKDENDDEKRLHLWMLIVFWTVLILFTIVKTKIVHYSSLAYFPLTFLAALYIYRLLEGKMKIKKYVHAIYLVVGGLYLLLPLFLQLFVHYKERIIATGIIKDSFAVGNLQASPDWTGFEFFAAIIPAAGLILFLKWRKSNIQKAVVAVFLSTMLFVYTILITVVPKIEKYSQHAAISFYKSLQGKDARF